MKNTSKCLLFLLFTLYASTSFSYTCDNTCTNQCTKEWLGNNLDPICFTGCKSWQLPNCYDYTDPWVSGVGELGQSLYVGAATLQETRYPSWQPLSSYYKDLLRPTFGNLVDEVKIHWDASPLDDLAEPSNPAFLAMGYSEVTQEILVAAQIRGWHGSAAQTFGKNIYINYSQGELNWIEEVSLIAHEMVHTLQYKNRNSSLHTFGRDYFEGWSNYVSYSDNPMEVEAREIEEKFLSKLIDDVYGYEWDFNICNNSDTPVIKAAIGYEERVSGFTLVPIIKAEGWWFINRNECKLVRVNQSSDAPLWYFATSSITSTMPKYTWGGGSKSFCVDESSPFEIGDQFGSCSSVDNFLLSGFKLISPSQRGTYTLNLTGGGIDKKQEICNKTSSTISLSRMYKQIDDSWISKGWYNIDSNKCSTFNYGSMTSEVYLNATLGDKVWPLNKREYDVDVCVKSTAFSFLYDRNSYCLSEGGRFEASYLTYLQEGTSQINLYESDFLLKPVDGKCGYSNNSYLSEVPINGLCDSGTNSSVSNTGLSWNWSCSGNNGGSPAYCSAYTVENDDNYESNNSLAEAFSIVDSDGIWLSTINGYGIQNDDDWFKIYVKSGSEKLLVELTFNHSQGDIDMGLYDSSGTLLEESTSTDDNENIDYAVPYGDNFYYIRVYYGNKGNSYDLKWGNSAINDPEVNCTTGTVNSELNVYVPSLNFIDQNIWAEFEFYGVEINDYIWKVIGYGINNECLNSNGGRVSADFEIRMNSLNYETKDIWAEFVFHGTTQTNEYLFKLKRFGGNN